MDLTVEDAPSMRDFYAAVLGWQAEEVQMNGYADYAMGPDGEAVAGICHARGPNRGLPAAWIVYWVVDDLDEALRCAKERGGVVIDGPRGSGARLAVLQDPAGAVFALWQAAPA
jgi:predicted enzyme related to lactoylglutathione lyase